MSDSAKELQEGATNLVLERLSSPLLFSFALAWCVGNYKALLVLISENPVTVKFHLLSKVVYPDALQMWAVGFGVPLAIACAYVFLYPPIERQIYRYLLNQRRHRDYVRRSIEEAPVLTVAEGDALRAEVEKKLAAAAAEVQQAIQVSQVRMSEAQRADERIQRLESEIENLCVGVAHALFSAPENSELAHPNPSVARAIAKTLVGAVKSGATGPGFAPSRVKLPNLDIEHFHAAIELLEGKGLVTSSKDSGGRLFVRLPAH